MSRRLTSGLIALFLTLSLCGTAFACDENQTNAYVGRFLGGSTSSELSSDKVRMLTDALYLCSAQSDNSGQDKLDYLQGKGVRGLPTLGQLNVKSRSLSECSHGTWEHVPSEASEAKASRKKALLNTVGTVFDFGPLTTWFGVETEKRNSFAALLYYCHILADHIADDPAETEANVGGALTSPYSGSAYAEVNGNKPRFSDAERARKESFAEYSPLDSLGRAGVVTACIGPDTINAVGQRVNMASIRPTGWDLAKYEGLVNAHPPYLYNRCHLLAHSLGGEEVDINLVTGTRYMNWDGMESFESRVLEYIKSSGNHVLYRATPVFKSENLLVSGVQLEAYSVEDAGTGLQFNVFCYNVQPGIDLNYANGDSERADQAAHNGDVLPFAVPNATSGNPDLILEMEKHMQVLFDGQKDSATYRQMDGEINTIARASRSIAGDSQSDAKVYMELKKYQYEYLDVLSG